MMRHVSEDIAALFILLCAIGLFFFRLFVPQPMLIVTPDYGRSDAWHFSFPTKFALSQSLRERSLPLWRDDIGSGFPLFAEGQTGALFLPNLLLFRTLPAVPAYNLALMGTIVTLALGMYWWCRVMDCSPIASLFAAGSLSFSGLTMSQLPHITLLQGISLLPAIASASTILTTGNRPFLWTGMLSLLLTQQIFAGFPQATFLTLLLSGAIVIRHTIRTKRPNTAAWWLLGVGLGITGGAAQLLPSWEFLRAGTDPSGFSPATASMFSMPLKHLASLVSPFALGNPKFGTYPPFYAFDGSIFWENTAYIGLLPLLLLVGHLVRRRKPPQSGFWWLIAGISLLLAWGKYAPTYLLFSIWPMTLFRVPSRFLWLMIVAIVILGALTIDTIRPRVRTKRTTLLLWGVIMLHIASLGTVWWNYHLMEPAETWLRTPVIKQTVGTDRIMTIANGAVHNQTMAKTGWGNPDAFRFLRENASPDSNMLWGISQHDVYAGRYLKRPAITDTLLSQSLHTDESMATVSAHTLLDMFAIRYVVSLLPLDARDLNPVQRETDGSRTMTVYENPSAVPRAYISYEATTAATLTEAVTILSGPAFIPGVTTLLERQAVSQMPEYASFVSSHAPAGQPASSVDWLHRSHTDILLRVRADRNALLVLADTYYPGWIANVDGNTTPVLAANLSQRAVFVPQGTHTVSFTYEPKSLWWGSIASVAGFIIIVCLMTVPTFFSAVHIRKTAPVHARYRRDTRRRS